MKTSANLVSCKAFSLVVVSSAAVLLSHLCFCLAQPHCINNSCGEFFTISYPFGLADSHVQGDPNLRCGHPDFQIHCHSGTPHLAINGVNYSIIGRPLYDQTKITIVKSLTNSVCSVLDGSLNLSASPFSLPSSYEIQTLQIECSHTTNSVCAVVDASVDLSAPPFNPPHKIQTLQIVCNKSHSWESLLCNNPIAYVADPTSFLRSCICNNPIAYVADPMSFLRSCMSPITVPMSPIRWIIATSNLAEEIEKALRKGFDILWNERDEAFERCRKCTAQKGFCGFNDSNPFVCYHPQDPNLSTTDNSTDLSKSTVRRDKSYTGFILGVSVGSALLVSFAVILALRRRKKDLKSESFNSVKDKDMELGPQLLVKKGSVQVFTYQELEEATDSFDLKRELGDGGFASVYLGKLCDGRLVAVKKLFHDNCRRVEQFDNEVQILSQLNHPNLVLLIGYCHYRSELLLVYEYASNGTLADHLHGEKDLKWQTRLNIALETAQALSYLHFCVKPPIFHRDVKSTNILLDENFSAKVADFGLSRLVPPEATHISTGPQGTPGYLDPDYHQSYRLTDKSDVYSFGVVLAEVISAKKAVDITRESREVGLAHLAVSKIQCGALHELVDPNLEVEKNPEIKDMVWRVAELAFRCLAPEKDDRPNMMEVAAQLLQIKEFGCGGNSEKQPGSVNSFDSDQEIKKLLSHVYDSSPASVQGIWTSTSTTPDSS